jgi:hypothetical protein
MSLLVVIGVSLAVFLYVRSTRRARRIWLRKLDLPGRWCLQTQASQADTSRELTLHGELDHGDFVYQVDGTRQSGQWRLTGHMLTLTGERATQTFDLHFFKAGNIGLEDNSGARLVFNKLGSNVVPLHSRSAGQ